MRNLFKMYTIIYKISRVKDGLSKMDDFYFLKFCYVLFYTLISLIIPIQYWWTIVLKSLKHYFYLEWFYLTVVEERKIPPQLPFNIMAIHLVRILTSFCNFVYKIDEETFRFMLILKKGVCCIQCLLHGMLPFFCRLFVWRI